MTADTLQVKNFVEIALSHTLYEINVFLHFTQQFKVATIFLGGKTIFDKMWQMTVYTLQVKKIHRNSIVLPFTISEINVFFKFYTYIQDGRKNGGNDFLKKVKDDFINPGRKFCLNLYLAPFPR